MEMAACRIRLTSLLVYCLTSPHLRGVDVSAGSDQAVGVHVHNISSQGLKVTCGVHQWPGKAVRL